MQRVELESMAEARINPVLFFREVLGWEPWSKQIEVAEAVRDALLGWREATAMSAGQRQNPYDHEIATLGVGDMSRGDRGGGLAMTEGGEVGPKNPAPVVRAPRYVAVRSGNGTGKTAIAAQVMLWVLRCWPNSKVITTAPTTRQVEQILWREARAAYHGARVPLGGRFLPATARWDLDDGRFAIGLSPESTNSERFQGFHAETILFIVDEASAVPAAHWEAIHGSALAGRAAILAIGNPMRLGGEFYDAFHTKAELWKRIAISAFDTPNLQGLSPQSLQSPVGAAGWPPVPSAVLAVQPERVGASPRPGELMPPQVQGEIARHGGLKTATAGDGPPATADWGQPRRTERLAKTEGDPSTSSGRTDYSPTPLRFPDRRGVGVSAGGAVVPADPHPNLPPYQGEGVNGVPGLVTPEGVEEARKDWGEDSPMWTMRILGDFPTSSSHSLIDLTWLEKAAVLWDAWRSANPEFLTPTEELAVEFKRDGARWALGVDVARSGTDFTAFALLRDDAVIRIESWRGQDTMRTAGLIKRLWDTFYVPGHPDPPRLTTKQEEALTVRQRIEREGSNLLIAVDDGGVGGGLVDRLRELNVSVHAVKFGGSPDGKKAQLDFTTKSAEMFWVLRQDLLEGKLAVPSDSKLRSQLTGIEYEVESDRAIRVHKQGKKKQSASPDIADALALAVEARNRGKRFLLLVS